MVRIAVLALVALLLPPAAADASARAAIVDPVGDVRLSFEPVTDLAGLAVTWDGTLTIAATYAGSPRSSQLSLLVSAASADAHDPGVEECDPEMADALTVDATGGSATLEVNGVDGALRADGKVEGTTITYSFASDALVRSFGAADPFVCASGSADGDAFFGGFDGKELKVTPAVAERGARAELIRRYGTRFTSSRRTEIRCLERAIVAEQMADEYTDYIPANAWCAYEFRQNARTYRAGEVRVVLDAGVPEGARLLQPRAPEWRASVRYDRLLGPLARAAVSAELRWSVAHRLGEACSVCGRAAPRP